MRYSKISRRDFMLLSSAAFLNRWKNKNILQENKKERITKADTFVKVLGTAQDGGLPQAGCYCSHCLRARQDKNFRRFVSSIAIINEKGNRIYLIDATPDIREQIDLLVMPHRFQERGKRNPMDALLLTHGHTGHYSGLVHLGREAAGVRNLPVYCTKSMGDFLEKNGPWSLMVQLGNIKLNRFEPNQIIMLDNEISFRALLVPHRAEFTDTVAFEIIGPRKRLLYLPDIDRWEPVEQEIRKLLSRVDYALLDGTFFSADELSGRDISQVPHPLIPHTIELFKDIVNKKKCSIFFIHLNHTNKLLSDEKARGLIREQGFEIAEDGMELVL
jgi:pyrroloquinoline quinone biosynthesis protein B